ncbi:LysR family transcriptional regulator [Aeromicrobium erythreum]|uniref:LysR family transcriptional regulator n=1 Tax=Aeromicrobium erythreum TaxID=2041 RepID=A0A0U4CT10_9ACTN|nr:LysR family transcriptional regulator [Aeromicrobium erythreum]ALX06262.1 LysR family transcriptional regulator [Aeromicrobium erythreum]
MTPRLRTDDLVLAEAVARHGSVGAAAKELLTTQPSASRRLAALERRLGTRLFERDTTGARPTPAGRELARHAARLLAELEMLPAHVQAATETRALSLGTIQSLAPIVFTAAQVELPDIAIQGEVDHGPVLVGQVHQGLLDAAIITIAGQTVLPHGLRTVPLGSSSHVLVLPHLTPAPGKDGRDLAGREVIHHSIDLAGHRLHAALSALGAHAHHGLTLETTLRVARHRRVPAVVPEMAALWWDDPRDTLLPSPVTSSTSLQLVTRQPPHALLERALPGLRARILGVPRP